MSESPIAARDEEVPFTLDEIFYSTTDSRGVIESANETFLRVSGYQRLDAVVGRPHRIVRHPDMPRVVFKLFWEHLEGGRSIAAYVKNLAMDGRYYWVMALAVPSSAGFVSIRFKPSSALFETVRGIYAELLEIEAAHADRRAGMAAAEVRLGELLKAAGYDSYDAFMQTALAAETAARQAHMGPASEPDRRPVQGAQDVFQTIRSTETELMALFSHAESFLTFIQKLDARSAFLHATSRRIQLLAKNALIESCRMKDSGRGLAVVTDNLAIYARESQTVISAMTVGMSALAVTLRETSFAVSAARLQAEMGVFMVDERARLDAAGRLDDEARRRWKTDLDIFVSAFTDTAQRMLASLPANKRPLQELLRKGDRLSEALMMLLSVHVVGRVEAAQVAEDGLFVTLFEEVLVQLHSAEKEMKDFTKNLNYLAETLPKFDRSAQTVTEAIQEVARQGGGRPKAALPRDRRHSAPRPAAV